MSFFLRLLACELTSNNMSECVLCYVIYGNNITILTSEKFENLDLWERIEAKVRRYYYLDGGAEVSIGSTCKDFELNFNLVI